MGSVSLGAEGTDVCMCRHSAAFCPSLGSWKGRVRLLISLVSWSIPSSQVYEAYSTSYSALSLVKDAISVEVERIWLRSQDVGQFPGEGVLGKMFRGEGKLRRVSLYLDLFVCLK